MSTSGERKRLTGEEAAEIPVELAPPAALLWSQKTFYPLH